MGAQPHFAQQVMTDAVASPAALPRESEVAVIGAGVVGLCTALRLAREGKDVVILERARPFHEASGVNAGSLVIQTLRPPIVPLAVESIRLWGRFGAELGRDAGYVPCGGLRVASSQEDVAVLRSSERELRRAGVETEWLEGSLLRARAPWLGPDIRAATFCAEEGFGSPLLAGPALIRAVVRAGATLLSGAEVRRITPEAGRFHLYTPGGVLRCRSLVIAAGAWSGKLAGLLGCALPIGLLINMVSVTDPYPPVMDRLVIHARRDLTLKQYPHGSCLIGGGWQGRGDLETGRKDLDYPRLIQNYRHAAGVVPKLADLHIIRTWAGFEGATDDEFPLFGPLPGHRNAFVVACVRGGFTLGPVLGRLMAELILTGETSMPVPSSTSGGLCTSSRP